MPPALIATGTRIRGTGLLCARSIARTFADHRALYVCALVFCGLTLAIAALWRIPLPFSTSLFFLETMPQFVILGLGIPAFAELIRLLRAGETKRPTRAMGRWLYEKTFTGDRPGNIFHTLVTFTPLMIAFSALKIQIPAIHPFAWDHTFMLWDRALAFGHDPWRLLQPILGYPPITAGINFVYDMWFVVMFGTLFWQAFAVRGSMLRTQFLLSFAFAWFIAGNVLAAIFSSVGPCFYGHFFAADPYAAQMQYLHKVAAHWPVWSVGVQNMLWQSYETGKGAVSGISAMPSMHVTVAVLVALLGLRSGKWPGIAGVAFAFLIVIGSVHLGWHYAVDSLAAIALALLFWYAAGFIARAEARTHTLHG